MFKKRVGYAVWAGLMIGLVSQGSWANNSNFQAAAGQTGCRSLILTDEVTRCLNLSATKDATCNRSSTCELDRQERWQGEYKTLLEKWGKATDTEKAGSLRNELREKWNQLETGRTAANAGLIVARECIAAREAVQNYFQNTAIPLTERTRNDLVSTRKGLVEKFNETRTKRQEAEEKAKKAPTDDSARREWEAAREANIEAGRKLDQFDKDYGPDIWNNAEKLLRHYVDERRSHETPTQETANRRDKCQKTIDVRYDSLPSGV